MKNCVRFVEYLKNHVFSFQKVTLEDDFEITEFDMMPYIDCYLEQDHL